MPPEESHYAGDWLRIAERDLQRVELLLNAKDPEAAGFFLQQAVEKSLKAFLLSRGWQLQRIHDLEALLNQALMYLPAIEEFRAVYQKVTGFYVLDRYPFLTQTGISVEEVSTALQQVKALIETLRQEAVGE
jgi:HEPN domain-containing protein